MNSKYKEEWIKDQTKKVSLVSPEIIPSDPVHGFFFKVNNLEIPEKIFKEEFDQISKAYFSVLHKLQSKQHKG
jgi:hypothetical protein